MPARDSLKLKDPPNSATSARARRRIDGADITIGKAMYGIDAKLDGMVYAVVARPPVLGSKVKSFDEPRR